MLAWLFLCRDALDSDAAVVAHRYFPRASANFRSNVGRLSGRRLQNNTVFLSCLANRQ